MFTHMIAVKRVIHHAHGAEYAILVFQIKETDEYKIFIAKDGFDAAGNVFTAQLKMRVHNPETIWLLS